MEILVKINYLMKDPILLFLYNIIISDDINDNFTKGINFKENKRMIISNLNIGINFDIDKEKN